MGQAYTKNFLFSLSLGRKIKKVEIKKSYLLRLLKHDLFTIYDKNTHFPKVKYTTWVAVPNKVINIYNKQNL